MKYYLGIDLGGTKVAFGIANENKEIIATTSIPTDAKRPYEVVIKDIGDTAVKFLKEQNIADVENVGIGVPGCVNPKTKRLEFAVNLGWYDVDVTGDLGKIINKNVSMANDADLATYGELLGGSAKEYNSITMLTLGTGVGGGVVQDGVLFGGGDGGSFELGHLTLVANGLECSCKNKGCLEMYTSTSSLIRYARENAIEGSKMYEMCGGDLSKIDGRIIFSCANEGDTQALKTLEIYLDYLVPACYNVIMAYRPDALVIGGGISAQHDLLIKPLNEKVQVMLERMALKTPIIPATLGNDAGILGACFLKQS